MSTSLRHYKYEFEMHLFRSKTPVTVDVFANDFPSAKKELDEAVKDISVRNVVIRRISQV